MDLVRYWYLVREFFHPLSQGAYYDGEGLRSAGPWPSRPARLYVAVSHGTLYFQHLRLPAAVPPDKLPQALALEAGRLLNLMEGQAEEVSCAPLALGGGEYLVAFRERSFFEKLRPLVPRPLVLCGLFPAWVALLAWFWQRGPLSDGLYFVRTGAGVEGFVWEGGQVRGLVPFSPRAAEALLKEHEGHLHEAEGLEALAQGAALVPSLPPKWQVSFDRYPLRLRPQVSKKALLLWLLPVLLWGVGLGLEHRTRELQHRTQALTQRLKALRQEEEALKKQLEEQKLLEDLAREIQSYQQDSSLLKALAELARVLPADTWVRKLEFRAPDVIQLWGESRNTLEVVKRLEESPLFREVKVLSSVTKNPRTGKENFAIRAHLEGSP